MKASELIVKALESEGVTHVFGVPGEENLDVVDFGNPDFVMLAKSYGGGGHRIDRAQDLAPRPRSCFADGGVHVVEISMDYSQNVADLNERLRQRNAALTHTAP